MCILIYFELTELAVYEVAYAIYLIQLKVQLGYALQFSRALKFHPLLVPKES